MKNEQKIEVGDTVNSEIWGNGQVRKKNDTLKMNCLVLFGLGNHLRNVAESSLTLVSKAETPNSEDKQLREGGVDYKAKYEKCISVIKRFDPGIIGMYDL